MAIMILGVDKWHTCLHIRKGVQYIEINSCKVSYLYKSMTKCTWHCFFQNILLLTLIQPVFSVLKMFDRCIPVSPTFGFLGKFGVGRTGIVNKVKRC